MLFKYYRLAILIIALTLSNSIEARGGRSSGGGSRSSGSRSSGSRSSSGGFWSGLFGGGSKKSSSSSSSSSSSYSSPPKKETYHSPSYSSYPTYHHIPNYGSTFGGRETYKPYTPTYDFGSSNSHPINSRSSVNTDYLNGYMTGSLYSHHFNTQRILDDLHSLHPELTSSHSSGNSHARPMIHDSHQSETTSTTTEANIMPVLDVLNELNELSKPSDPNESLDTFLNRMLKFTETNLWHGQFDRKEEEHSSSTTTTTTELASSSTEMPAITTTNIPMQAEPTNMAEQSISDSQTFATVADVILPPNVDQLPLTESSAVENMPSASTEATLDTAVDISTPNGVICVPIVYDEVNEFGVKVTIEKIGCYPAPEPVTPKQETNVSDLDI